MSELSDDDAVQMTPDYVSVDLNHQYVSDGQESFAGNIHQAPACKECEKREAVLRPHLTVNVFNTSGPSIGESGMPKGSEGSRGSGLAAGGLRDDNVTVKNHDGGGEREDLVSLLASQVADLSKKVEHLSLQAPNGRMVVESGVWSTVEVRSWERPEKTTQAEIVFANQFQRKPTVTTSISAADVARETNFRVRVYATSITTKGFIIHADSWADTKLYSCRVSWLAIGEC